MTEFWSETPRTLWKRCWRPENIHIVGQQTYEGLKISINSITETTQFLLWHQDITMLLKTKKFKPIANGNVADSGMIALIDEPFPCWKPKKEWKFKCKSWIKKLINCCFSQIKTKHKLTACLTYLLFLFLSLWVP